MEVTRNEAVKQYNKTKEDMAVAWYKALLRECEGKDIWFINKQINGLNTPYGMQVGIGLLEEIRLVHKKYIAERFDDMEVKL